MEDRIDTGLAVHYRAQKDCSLELKVGFNDSCVIYDPIVVLKVRTPTLVGAWTP